MLLFISAFIIANYTSYNSIEGQYSLQTKFFICSPFNFDYFQYSSFVPFRMCVQKKSIPRLREKNKHCVYLLALFINTYIIW
jgi:hypothetical protein